MKCKRNEDENENENELTNERMTELMNQRNNEPVKQWINESMNQWISEPMNQWTNESMNQRINESLNQWINESMNQWNLPTSSSKSALKPSVFKLFMWNRALPTVSCTFCIANSTMPKKNAPNVCICLRLLCEIELSLQSCAHFAGLIFQKCSKHVIFCGFYMKSSSRYSLVHILPTSSSKSVPNMSICFPTFLWNRALATVSCTFRRSHLPKVLRTWQLFNIFKRKSSSRYSPVHVLLIEAHNRRNRDPTSANTEATLPEKNTGFRARAFSSLNSRVPDLLHFPTTWWWCGWHDDALAWWWECCPWQSSVTRKYSN